MKKKTLPEWDQLGFGLVETDEIYRAVGNRKSDPIWEPGRLESFVEIALSPTAALISYGQEVFERRKARRTGDGRILLFRLEENARRFGRSAERLGMPAFPGEEFQHAVREVVRSNERFVPPAGSGSFYLRPVMLAIEPRLGLSLCDQFGVTVYGSPVGSYFGKGDRAGLRVRVLEQGRVAPGGTGAAKAMGNYAGTIPLAAHWKARGFDDVLFLDARDVRFVTETVGSNVFAVMSSGTVVTPPLDDQILPGITRDSVLRIARELLGFDVEERPLPIDEVMEEGAELFFAGTAYTLQSVAELSFREEAREFTETDKRDALYEILDGIQTGRREDPFGWVGQL
jgi:branched-chain amino acid aminotransferase